MDIKTILAFIDNGIIVLPEFQRGYVWNRDQVRGLFDSLYRRHPVGSLLVWATSSTNANVRGVGGMAPGIVKLLLDGQQRMTTLYGVMRGQPPQFFDGNPKAFTDLRFNLEREVFEFYQPISMKGDPLWIDVTATFKEGQAATGTIFAKLASDERTAAKAPTYISRVSQLLGIADIEVHIEEIAGDDKSLDVVVDIFNRVNSGGTKLSKGDLALAKICADWPNGRDAMKSKLHDWENVGYQFNLDWLLRSVNTVLTGEAKFLYLHDKTAGEIQGALDHAIHHIDTTLNMISGRLGLDHDRVFFGRFAVPVIARYLELRKLRANGPMTAIERDKLLFWYVQAAMWGRFSGSTETFIDQDLAVLENPDDCLDELLKQLRLWHGGLRAEPGHFTGWSLGARFYPVLYMLTRVGGAKDWGTGLPLSANLNGKMNKLEVHHIFPKALLRKHKYSKSEVNALANFCFLTKDTNLSISDTPPEVYFDRVETAHPGALASQWIPMDTTLWKVANYRDFMEARKILLAQELNRQMADLLHGDTQWLEKAAAIIPLEGTAESGVFGEAEEQLLEELNNWVVDAELPPGIVAFDFADEITGAQQAVFDLAWPNGLQEELSQPVAVLLNESPETIALASQAGFRCFTDVAAFRQYVEDEVLAGFPF